MTGRPTGISRQDQPPIPARHGVVRGHVAVAVQSGSLPLSGAVVTRRAGWDGRRGAHVVLLVARVAHLAGMSTTPSPARRNCHGVPAWRGVPPAAGPSGRGC